MNDWHTRARALVACLAERGYLADPRWQAAFEAVPRHVFVPRFYLDDETLIDGDDPAQERKWLDAVYRDDALVTQLAAVPGTDLMWATSSSTMPSLMAYMLDLLDVQDGQRVLEIGTGTGYNAAILCHRLGDMNVASIDLHPDLVDSARGWLAQLGYWPCLAAGDGAEGMPDRAPFDRILATCAVPALPAAWISQLRTGGLVAPISGAESPAVWPRCARSTWTPSRATFSPLLVTSCGCALNPATHCAPAAITATSSTGTAPSSAWPHSIPQASATPISGSCCNDTNPTSGASGGPSATASSWSASPPTTERGPRSKPARTPANTRSPKAGRAGSGTGPNAPRISGPNSDDRPGIGSVSRPHRLGTTFGWTTTAGASGYHPPRKASVPCDAPPAAARRPTHRRGLSHLTGVDRRVRHRASSASGCHATSPARSDSYTLRSASHMISDSYKSAA